MLEMIIEFKGCVAPECRLRHGHRLKAHNRGRVLKNKVINRQRKHLLKMGPIHYDAQEALLILLNEGPAEEELAKDELQEALVNLDDALDAIPEADNEEEDDIPDDHPAGQNLMIFRALESF